MSGADERNIERQDLADIKIQHQLRNGHRIAPVLKEAENEAGDDPRDEARDHADYCRDENVGRVVRHEIVPGYGHEQHDDHRGDDELFALHQAQRRHARGACGDMPRGEGEPILERGADKHPPLAELLDCLKRARSGDGIFKDNIRDECAAAYRAEHAHAGVTLA